MLRKVLGEYKIFGVMEVLYHLWFRITKSSGSQMKMLLMREEKFENSNLDISLIIKQIAEAKNNREMNVINPVKFCEKIQWIKINDVTQIKVDLSDKYKVREWIEKKIGKEYLIPLLGCWNSMEDVGFSDLPEQFCLKTNHGSGMNYVVKDINKIDIKKVSKLFDEWLKTPFYMQTLEMQYKPIERKIIVEKYIEEMNGNLYDYKFHCFSGEPIFIQCIGNRDISKHTGYQCNYDLEWKKLPWIFEDYPRFPYDINRPEKLDEMTDIARKLSEGFNYVRVDLYEVEGQIKFGEMTFTPASGMYPYKGTWNEERDLELGKLINVKL